MGNSESVAPPSAGSGGCPVKHRAATPPSAPSTVVTEECPVKHKYKNPNVYNVYGQKLDPTNQMPAVANQQAAPGQTANLSTARIKSTIPKGGTDDDTWLYPSPQMFWNALVRKEKTDGADEKDIDAVIAVHNNMNENTWRQVLSWEHIRSQPSSSSSSQQSSASTGNDPKLLRFMGRPDELSPKARLKMLFGHPAPFDRHDWVVDRGGTERRYVIDYYHDESGVGKDARPAGLEDTKSIQSIKVDVRPALDSLGAVWDRVVAMPLQQTRGYKEFQPPPFFAPKAMIQAENSRGELLTGQWKQITTTCASHKEALARCQGETECGAATVKLQRCTGMVVCPQVVADFDSCVGAGAKAGSASGSASGSGSWAGFWSGSGSGNKAQQQQQAEAQAKTGKAYGDLLKCLELFEIESRNELGKAKAKR